ncbi:hypothetical protein FB451DRAFT_1560174 [Mycena latifolia]|nr:hypothetical protein FB451DRAFT_1560174 [Mycena latifolia]
MAPPPWATPEQTSWLDGWLKDYITRQAEHKLHIFWPAMFEAWFRQFPEYPALGLPMPNDPSARELTEDELVLLGDAIKLRRKRLRNWFRNHRAKVKNSSTAPSVVIRKLFNIDTTKRHRAHKPVELFQKRNKEQIDLEIERERKGLAGKSVEAEGEDDDSGSDTGKSSKARVKKNKSEHMLLRMRVVNALFADAAQEELDEIDAEIAREKEVIQAEEVAKESLDTSVAKTRSPEELQSGIDQLDGVFKELHHATYNAAGWVGMTILGGPNPRLEGELSVKIICFGETPAGNDFEDVCVDFDKNVTEPFEAFLRAIYTAQECKARAMPPRSEPSAPEGRVTRDDAPAAALPTKAKEPKRIRKTKKDKARKIQQKIDDADGDNVSEAGSVDDSTSFLVPDPSVLGSDDHDRHQDDDFDDFLSDTIRPTFSASTRDDDPFDDAEVNPLPSWPLGMSAPSSPATAAAAAMRERGGTACMATMAIDPLLLPPTSPTLRPTPRPSYRGTESYTEALAAAGVVAPLATASVGGFNFPLTETGTTPPPPPPPSPPPSTAEGDGLVPAPVATRILPQSRPPAKAPGAPKKTSTAKAKEAKAKEAKAKEVKKLEVAKAVAKRGRKKAVVEEEEAAAAAAPLANTTKAVAKRGRPKKVVEEEEVPLANTTNEGGRAGGRARRNVGFSVAAELQRFHELNMTANAIEAAAAAKAAGGITRLPNPDGPSDIIVLTRTRKAAKRPDGSEVQLPVKGKRAPANPHAASEAAMLARSAKANGTGATKRKMNGAENVAAPRAKKART